MALVGIGRQLEAKPTVECRECIILRSWLAEERLKLEETTRLLYLRAGVIIEGTTPHLDDDIMKPIHKAQTISSLRRDLGAELAERAKAAVASQIASDAEKTQGEIAFEEAFEEVHGTKLN